MNTRKLFESVTRHQTELRRLRLEILKKDPTALLDVDSYGKLCQILCEIHDEAEVWWRYKGLREATLILKGLADTAALSTNGYVADALKAADLKAHRGADDLEKLCRFEPDQPH